jgi:hypothetical protein
MFSGLIFVGYVCSVNVFVCILAAKGAEKLLQRYYKINIYAINIKKKEKLVVPFYTNLFRRDSERIHVFPPPVQPVPMVQQYPSPLHPSSRPL